MGDVVLLSVIKGAVLVSDRRLGLVSFPIVGTVLFSTLQYIRHGAVNTVSIPVLLIKSLNIPLPKTSLYFPN